MIFENVKEDVFLYETNNYSKNINNIFYLELIDQIKNNNIYLVYQPKIMNEHSNIIGFEALLRIRGNEEISIENFIKCLEYENLIYVIDFYVMREAVKQIEVWKREGRKSHNISINMAARTMLRKEFRDVVTSILRDKDIDGNLEIEITERDIPVHSINDINKSINFLKDLNVKVAIDDFGVGYSNINLLLSINIDTLKIDRSLIQNIKNNNKTKCVLKCLFNMCKMLKIDTVIEGIEEKEEFELLNELGGEIYQGYYFSKPLKVDEVISRFNF